ncbi:MAG: hypothetical protein M1822_004239 [Bathelium mastoideum]|nr:MAG: hypothetical protein M1822_004239 [Bathelium mastoideum]
MSTSSSEAPLIFVIGGTGAQGIPVIKSLVEDKAYRVRALTRDTASSRAQSLLALGNVELLPGTFTSESALRAGFSDAYGCFVNIDGFNAGEKTELFWAIRIYELALECGIRFFVYGNLDYAYKKSGYNPATRAGHFDGKGRVGEWILMQTRAGNGEKMGAALFTTGPYMEMTLAAATIMSPQVSEDGVVTWGVPSGDSTVATVALEDCGYYVRWLFDHPQRANGLDLQVSIADTTFKEVAAAFEKVTGKPARHEDVTLEEYWESGPAAHIAKSGRSSAYNSDLSDPAAMTFKENFSGFWNIWKLGGVQNGFMRRDYRLLDEIHPNRIKSAEQWFRLEDERGRKAGLGGLYDRVQPGNLRPVLKLQEDGFKGGL